MTTNYLILKNITGEHSLADAVQVLRNDGFHLLPVNGNEVRIDGSLLSGSDMAKIIGSLKALGFQLASLMQQSWRYPSPRVDVLL